MKNRSLVTVIYSIVKACKETDCGKACLMQKAGLSSKMLNRYLDIMLDSGIIRIHGRIFKPTGKGERLYHLIPQVMELLN